MNISRLLSNIFVHVFILFVFLSSFFFLFASKLAKNSMKNELKEKIDDSIDNFYNSLDDKTKQVLAISFENTKDKKIKQLFDKEDPVVKEHNKCVKTLTIIACILLLINCIIFIWIMKLYKNNVPISSILKENIITFTMIGTVEIIFFMYIAFKFVPVPPSILTNTIISTVNNRLSEN